MLQLFKKNELYAPVTGKIIPLEKVPDQVFATKMMGDGIAFDFSGEYVCAPCDGKIMMIANTKHSFGMVAQNGAEILIHIGLDTVNYQGKGFQLLAKTGDKVKKGQPIIQIDRDFFGQENVNLITPMIITNEKDHPFVVEEDSKDVIVKESVVIKFQ